MQPSAMVNSDSDESAVMVEHEDEPELKDEEEDVTASTNADKNNNNDDGDKDSMQDINIPEDAYAAQVVSVGTEVDQYAFTFHKEQWNDILSKVPAGWKVAVISVVGAFRTGKSFLLSWFLRYLYVLEMEQKVQKQKGKKASRKKWYERFDSVGKRGFDWKAGAERNTTGIWMWSQPFFLENETTGEPLAILLVDTQGMFDHETTMALTASIFGLSTLLSSYQIYNVDKRIQEDNLQQLALFSEYARTAMSEGEQENKPFQKIEFLVRDWQHFDEHEEGADGQPNYDAMEASMKTYLANVLADREASDLKNTREQIQLCFQEIDCYGLCHPGFAVTKKKYTGDVASLEEHFIVLLDRYCQRVFSDKSLQPKQIHDRELTAVELGSYIQAYADLFASGAKFPTAATLLDATASANNTNAVQLATKEYKDYMDRVAGPKCSNYLKPDELLQDHERSRAKAIKVFKSVATFGRRKSVEEAQKVLNSRIEDSWQVYESLNHGRNPLLGLEVYLLPTACALVAYIMRVMFDLTCAPYLQVCRMSSELLSHGYAVFFCFLFILAATKAKQVEEGFIRVRTAMQIVMDAPPNANSKQKKE